MDKFFLFILPSLRAGGAERIISYLAQELNTKFKIKLIVLGSNQDNKYNVENIDVFYLNKTRLLFSIISLFNIIRKEKPHIVFSSISHVNTLMALFSFYFKKIKFIAREASVISEMVKFSDFKLKLNKKIIYWLYPKLDLIICQSTDMRNDFINNFNINNQKLKVIHNPITREISIHHKIKKTNLTVNFITIGRLSKEKGHLRLLDILSKVNYDFRFTIIGEGVELENIKSYTNSLKLTDKIKFIPYTNNVLEELGKADFFLQGSYVEGFPNALLESCTVGTPVIAFDCPGGTKEIIQKGINGYLVDNDEEFLEILNNRELINNFNYKKVINTVESRFSSKKILAEYEKIFESL